MNKELNINLNQLVELISKPINISCEENTQKYKNIILGAKEMNVSDGIRAILEAINEDIVECVINEEDESYTILNRLKDLQQNDYPYGLVYRYETEAFYNNYPEQFDIIFDYFQLTEGDFESKLWKTIRGIYSLEIVINYFEKLYNR